MVEGDIDNSSNRVNYIQANDANYSDRKYWANTLFLDELPENFRVILYRDGRYTAGYKGDPDNLVVNGGHNLKAFRVMPAGENKIQLEVAYFGDYSQATIEKTARKKHFRWAVAIQDMGSGAISMLSKTWLSKFSNFSNDTTNGMLDWRLRPM